MDRQPEECGRQWLDVGGTTIPGEFMLSIGRLCPAVEAYKLMMLMVI